jgi:hypothetical protein
MRVSSLSDERVIALVSRYFVPVWVSRDHYQMDAPAKAEQEELLRIDRDRAKRRLEGGNVCVYLIAPDGAVTASLPVQRAWKPENLLPFLKKAIEEGKLQPRAPEAVRATTAPPRPPARPRTEGGLILHVWTRFEGTGPNRGSSEDWVELTAAEWAALAPARDAKPGAVRTAPREVADKLYRLCYPPGPHWDVKDSKVVAGKLTATVVAVSDKEVRLRLAGTLEMNYPSGGKTTSGRVTARFAGAARYDPVRRTFTALALASEEADYVWYWENKPQPKKMRIAVEKEP